MKRGDWVPTEGKIESIYVDGNGRSRHVSVVFTYKVDGHFYGGTFTPMPWQDTPAVGKAIAVRYDPDDPGTNDLVGNEHRWKWIVGIVVALFILGELIAAVQK